MDGRDLVVAVTDALAARGIRDNADIVKHVAWQGRALGYGLRRKNGGAGFDWNGQHFAGDIISLAEWNPALGQWVPNGINVDILRDAGGANEPTWSPYPPDPSVIQFHTAPMDPGFDVLGPISTSGGGAGPDPQPTYPLDERLGRMELTLNQTRAKLDELATKEQVAALATRLEDIRTEIVNLGQAAAANPGWLRKVLGF